MSDSESDTPIRTISNGHHYTDSYGKGTLPILADESGFLPAQPMERASDAPPDKCDCCCIEGKNASEKEHRFIAYCSLVLSDNLLLTKWV